MKQILNTYERRNKTPTKYKFHIVPKQLIVETDSKFIPEQIQIVCIHRKKRVSSKPRQLESSCTIDCRHLIVWPESMAELIEFETTLYKEDINNTLCDKSWTIVLEGTINKKAKNGKVKLRDRSALASADLNMKSMVGLPGELAEVQICMRPLCDEIKYCQIDFYAYSFEQKQTSMKASVETTPILAPTSAPTSSKIVVSNDWNSSTSRLESNNDSIIPPDRDEMESSIPKMVINPVLPSIPIAASRSADQNHRIVNDDNEDKAKNNHHGHEESATIITCTPTNVVMKKTVEELPSLVEEQNDSGLDKKQFSNVLPPNIQSSMPPPASAPARPQIISNNNGWNSPRMMMSNSGTRTKPVPPNQAEMEALIAQMIANKRPNLATTPLTSRTKISHQNKQISSNGDGQQSATTPITRQSSISNALKERSRKIEEELKQIDEEFARVEEQKMFVLDKLSDSVQNSEQERELMEHKQRLVNEMEQLVRRQDYLNVQLELEEVEFKISHLRSLLATTNSPIEEKEGTNWRINRMDDSNNAMLELKKLMDLKEALTHQLSDMEADDEEGIERSRLVLETTRKQNFLRGSEHTFNMSKRLMNWLGGMEQRFKQ